MPIVKERISRKEEKKLIQEIISAGFIWQYTSDRPRKKDLKIKYSELAAATGYDAVYVANLFNKSRLNLTLTVEFADKVRQAIKKRQSF